MMQTDHNINLNIPINFNQVLDIIRQLSQKDKLKLKNILENEQPDDIPEDHKNIVRQRIKTSESNPSSLLNWDEEKHRINL
jgi:hypothetical protein